MWLPFTLSRVDSDETQGASEQVASKCLDDTILSAAHKIRPIGDRGCMHRVNLGPGHVLDTGGTGHRLWMAFKAGGSRGTMKRVANGSVFRPFGPKHGFQDCRWDQKVAEKR